MSDPSGLCAVMQLQPLDDSQQATAHGGPNADDANTDPGSGGGAQGSGPCYESLWDWLDGGVSLDGGDITDTSGGEGVGFPVGGGGMIVYTFTAGPNMDWGAFSLDQLLALAAEGEIGLSESQIPGPLTVITCRARRLSVPRINRDI